MAFLDVSSVLLDPNFTTTFDVLSRPEAIVEGVPVITPVETSGVVGVITSAGRNDLMRLPEEQRMGRHLTVVTKHRLQGPTPGKQPDQIRWNGDLFVVLELDPYPQYGAGFIQAICASVDSIDQPVPEPE